MVTFAMRPKVSWVIHTGKRDLGYVDMNSCT